MDAKQLDELDAAMKATFLPAVWIGREHVTDLIAAARSEARLRSEGEHQRRQIGYLSARVSELTGEECPDIWQTAAYGHKRHIARRVAQQTSEAAEPVGEPLDTRLRVQAARILGYLADLTKAAEQHIKPGMDGYANVVAAREFLGKP